MNVARPLSFVITAAATLCLAVGIQGQALIAPQRQIATPAGAPATADLASSPQSLIATVFAAPAGAFWEKARLTRPIFLNQLPLSASRPIDIGIRRELSQNSAAAARPPASQRDATHPPDISQQNGAPQVSLGSLGFPSSVVKGNAREQALLDRRTRMLQIHQKLGLLTAIPLAATVIAGGFAKGPRIPRGATSGPAGSTTGRNVHAVLGTVTVGMYLATAYYAIRAPRPRGVRLTKATKWHEALAWIHGPGMILTPVLGAMAYAQRNRGERVHGIARAHGQVAAITLGAYVAALLVEARPHL